MNRFRLTLHRLNLALTAVLSAVLLQCLPASAVTPSQAELQKAREWLDSSLLQGTPYPFRFHFDGQSSTVLLSKWEKEHAKQRLDANRVQHVTEFRDPSGLLQVRLTATEYEDFPAVEWVLYFKNVGQQSAPILKHILPLWAAVQNPEEQGPFDVRYALGSHNRSDDFRLHSTRILSAGEGLNFSSYGGRSSDGHLPFFNLHHSSGGMMVGIGWTGNWTMRFHRPDKTSVNAVAGMPHTRIRLSPGEEIRSPAILLTFWEGDNPIRGHNLQRALFRKHFSPVPDSGPPTLPVAASPHRTIKFEDVTEQNLLEFLDPIIRHQLPIDTFWIDTGWFTLVDNHWAKSVGNFEPDPVRFPNGMKSIGDRAHSAGWRFLLWQEPERVMPGTWMYENHPQWLIAPPADLPFPFKYMHTDDFHLLDLGNSEALAWLIEKSSQLIEDAGVDIYRNDCNLYPSFYWQQDEPADRQGMREIRYVMGLYHWLDTLRSRHPELLIDNCASGGRRIDFEMLRRSVVLWRSDAGLANPIANQSISYNLAHWIPQWGGGGDPLDTYRFRSTLGPACVVSAQSLGDSESIEACKPIIQQYRTIRHLTEGDFYPLTPCSLHDNICVAWQLDRADLGEGLIQAFRRSRAENESLVLSLRGLEPKSEYIIEDLDDPGATTTAMGSKLMTDGFSVHLSDRDTAVLYHYRKKISSRSALNTQR